MCVSLSLCLFLVLLPNPFSLTSCSFSFLVQASHQQPEFSLIHWMHCTVLIYGNCSANTKLMAQHMRNIRIQPLVLHTNSLVNGNEQFPLFTIKACESNGFSGCAACTMRFCAMVHYCCFTGIHAIVRDPPGLQFTQLTHLLENAYWGKWHVRLLMFSLGLQINSRLWCSLINISSL